MTRLRFAGIVTALAVAVAVPPGMSAPQRDALIRPGLGIGKVRLGMSLAQVKRVLGPPQLANRRVRLGFGRTYVEYAWDYGFWRVAFIAKRGRYRAVLVGTVSRRERTRSGVGTGSSLAALRRALPVRCTMNGRYREPGSGTHYWFCMLGPPRVRHTVFLLGCDPPRRPTCRSIEVKEVVVREPV